MKKTTRHQSHPLSPVWAIGGCLMGVLITTLVYAPAQWLANSIAAISDDRVLLQAPRGTVWQGSAHMVLSGGQGSAGAMQLPSRISWALAPTGLGVTVQLRAPTALRLTVALNSLSSASWTIETPQLALPAEVLTGLGSPWNTLQLAGTLTLQTQPAQPLSGTWSTRLGLQNLAGMATLDATDMHTALSTVRPLGNYRATLQGATFKLETPQADAALQLSGTGVVGQSAADKTYFVGEAIAAAGKEAALSNLLHIIGQKQSGTDGRMRASLRIG